MAPDTLFEMLHASRHNNGEPDLVVEIIENLHIRDVELTRHMVAELRREGIQVAMDDLAISNGLLSFASFVDSTYVKFDRSWLNGLAQPKQLAIMEWTLGAARKLGVRSVLEGVEKHSDLMLAREMGFDYVQGFLFRERFVRTGNLSTSAVHGPLS